MSIMFSLLKMEYHLSFSFHKWTILMTVLFTISLMGVSIAFMFSDYENTRLDVKYLLASVIIPLFYIGMVFLCVAVTVLSVQQLSDSAKYRFR